MQKNLINIDLELWHAISRSPFNTIDYENLIEYNPAKIREEELILSLKNIPLDIPSELYVENVEIPSHSKSRKIRVRIYRRKEKHDLPVFMYFHGGAFIYGTPEQYDFMFFRLALDIDMLVVSVDYRLAPEHPFPAGVEDGYDVLQWLFEYSSQIGGNKSIMVGGSSAGATIAASLTHLIRDRKQIEIKHQYLLYPPMSHLMETVSMNQLAEAPMQSRVSAQWMWKHYLQNKVRNPPKYSVPLMEDNFKKLPEATIIVCEFDPFKDEGKQYAQILKQANIPVNLLEIKGAVHAFDFFSCALSNNFYDKQIELFKEILNQNK